MAFISCFPNLCFVSSINEALNQMNNQFKKNLLNLNILTFWKYLLAL